MQAGIGGRLNTHTRAQVLQQVSPRDDALLYADVRRAAAAPGSVRAYVEVHIEQGPVLESLGVPLGVVSAIAGQTRLSVSMTGEQGHAGTVPMHARRDTLTGAADAILAIEQLCQGARKRLLHSVFCRRDTPVPVHRESPG
jgi:acetylornithine deacetylase/succinyl-diaminopimelate desuccinylase-like protein